MKDLKGKDILVNPANVNYVELRESYTTQEAKTVVVFHFVGGSILDIAMTLEELLSLKSVEQERNMRAAAVVAGFCLPIG